MRLLIATPLYPPEPGGPATYAKILEEGLPSWGIEPLLVKFGEVRHLPKLARHIAYFFHILKGLKDADAALALDPVSTGLPTMLAAKLVRKPYLVKVVGDYAWEQGSQRFGVRLPLDEFVREQHVPFPVALLRRAQERVARSAAKVIVPSGYLKRIVSAWGIEPARIEVVYNTMQEEGAGSLPGELEELPRPWVVSAGRLVPWKGMPGLIDSMVGTSATLIIAGDGPDRASLEMYAAARLGSAVHFTGALPHANLLALIKEADMFVLNSTYEGLSHLLIEALALGKPVVATAVGGNPELIADGENGLLVPSGDRDALGDAITHLLATPEHRARLSERARISVARFSVDAMLSKTAEIIRNTA